MKKYHLYLWIVALVGLMTSCSQSETDALQTANESNRVTLNASLPEDFAQIGTRALPTTNSRHQLRCILEVWTKGEAPVLKHREEKVGLTGDNVVFEFKIDDGTYDCLFWADFIATNATNASATIGSVTYTHYADKYHETNTDNGLRAVSIIRTDYVTDGQFNSYARDAFFSHEELNKQAGKTGTLSTTLTRPFAKLIINETSEPAFGNYESARVIYTVPKTFNVLNGTASGEYLVDHDGIYPGITPILFSDLIFTKSAERETLGQINLVFEPRLMNPIDLNPVTIPAGVPIQRNYITTASGRLIKAKSNDAKVTVDMNADWNSPDIPEDLGE